MKGWLRLQGWLRLKGWLRREGLSSAADGAPSWLWEDAWTHYSLSCGLLIYKRGLANRLLSVTPATQVMFSEWQPQRETPSSSEGGPVVSTMDSKLGSEI